MTVCHFEDVTSYRAVNIPPERIMIIDKAGRVRRADEIGFESSYMAMAMETVDYMFPPLRRRKRDDMRLPDEQHTKSWVRMKSSFTKPDLYRYYLSSCLYTIPKPFFYLFFFGLI